MVGDDYDDDDENDVFASALQDAALLEVDDNSLLSVAELAKKQLKLQREVNKKTQELKVEMAKLKKLSEVDLPTALLEKGMRNFTLDDGSSVRIERFYGASIPTGKKGTIDARPQVFTWMVEHGHGHLIKTNVLTVFGKGEKERKDAQDFVKELQEDGFDAKLDESIHATTLKAWVKEQDTLLQRRKRLAQETGEKVDENIFPPAMTLFIGERAVVTDAD